MRHLRGAGVARRHPGGLERDHHGPVAGDPVREQVAFGPARELAVFGERHGKTLIGAGPGVIVGRAKAGPHPLDLPLIQQQHAVLDMRPLRLDLARELGRTERVDQDLDARLVEIVAPPMPVVHAQDGLQIRQQIALFQKRADARADIGRAAQAAADQHIKARLATRVFDQIQANVMHLHGRAVALRAGGRDLEFSGQEREFGVEGGPLADDLAIGPGVFQLIDGDPGELIAGDVADAVAAGLDRVHLHAGQIGQDVRHGLQPGPVILDILAGAEVAVALVIFLRDMGQHPELPRR